MTRRVAVVLVLLVVCLTGHADAQELTDLYDARALDADKDRYVARLDELLRVRLWNFFTRDERAAFNAVQLQVPLVGESGNPFDFYTIGTVGAPRVVMPVLSLKFAEDLSIAYAWLYTQGYRLEPMDEYVAMLRFKPTDDFPGRRRPPPLEALGVPEDGWQDPAVTELYLSLRNEAWAFILLHELGHVLRRHPGNAAVEPQQSQVHEQEADGFALDVMQRSQTIPMGMVLWFQATAPWFPNRARYRDADEFERAVTASLTHPVSPARLLAIARHLAGWSQSALDPTRGETVSFIGDRLTVIAEMLSEPDMQLALAALAQRRDLASLKPRR